MIRETKTEKIFRCLFVNRHGATIHQLIDAAYEGDEDGGALWAISSVGCLIFHLNKKLRPLGYEIACTNPRGGRGSKRLLRRAA